MDLMKIYKRTAIVVGVIIVLGWTIVMETHAVFTYDKLVQVLVGIGLVLWGTDIIGDKDNAPVTRSKLSSSDVTKCLDDISGYLSSHNKKPK